jgi:hypothetical protein
MEPKICKTCAAEGKKSKITVKGITTQLMCINKFYDEGGHIHVHDPNLIWTSYCCSNWHKWEEKGYTICWCGYNKDKQ